MPLPLMAGALAFKGIKAAAKTKLVKKAGSAILKGVKKTVTAARKAPAVVKKNALPAAKFVGTAAAYEAVGMGIKKATAPRGINPYSELPTRGGAMPGLPALPGRPGALQSPVPMSTGSGQFATMPDVLQLNHPNIRTFYRAPKGYVIVRDPATGQYYGAVRKDVARRAGLWKPAAKPPISATDWKHYKSAKRVEKKLKKIAGPALRKYSRSSPAKGKRK